LQVTAVMEPRTLDEARRAVEASRERISDTLNALELQLNNKKQELEAKVDVLRPVKRRVRARPLVALAIAFGVGVLLSRRRR
jgi:ElaB/YqjD/DUF883 family membrane-anchored ribosome-binding protein